VDRRNRSKKSRNPKCKHKLPQKKYLIYEGCYIQFEINGEVVSDELTNQLNEKANELFQNLVTPIFKELIEEYDGENGFQVKVVPDKPAIMGIKKHNSVMIKHPDGMEMIICIYWVEGHDKIVAENIMMVTLNKVFNMYEVTRDDLKKKIKFLAGLQG
jgi:hypothetical protein